MTFDVWNALQLYVFATILSIALSLSIVVQFTGNKKVIGLVLLVKSIALLSIILILGNDPLLALFGEWIITTPLTLVSLALLAMPSRNRVWKWILMLVVFDVIMIGLGWISAYANPSVKWWWYAAAFAPLTGIAWLLWGPIRKIAKTLSTQAYEKYLFLTRYTTWTWGIYPFVWLLGHFEGNGMPMDTILAVFFVMNSITKLTYVFLMNRSLASLPNDIATDESVRLSKGGLRDGVVWPNKQ